jgi:ubiquinone/menaquinone biosynthesis C-methylase UbiE
MIIRDNKSDPSNNTFAEIYRCINCKEYLKWPNGFESLHCHNCNSVFQYYQNSNYGYLDFVIQGSAEVSKNQVIYPVENIAEKYNNFLVWLFETMQTDQNAFRTKLYKRLDLQQKDRILITSCGTGEDLVALQRNFGDLNLEIYAQDISSGMIIECIRNLQEINLKVSEINVSDASRLPYRDNYFDSVFHFGGINYFSEKKIAISEMMRVAKAGATIGIIDESIAPWLRKSEFGKMMMNNNSLWEATPPMDLLPFESTGVVLTYELENCFYYLTFKKSNNFPNVNLDVPHIGPRGGTIRTRYEGALEGVTLSAKRKAIKKAHDSKISLSDYLTRLIERD